MLSRYLVGAMKKIWIIGYVQIHGALPGVSKDSLRSRWVIAALTQLFMLVLLRSLNLTPPSSDLNFNSFTH